ncbi:glycosyltransferase family 2 protein [Ferrovibrio xuzhouensis]|uniref:Glycosyltransferase family 2 protein n=1 Tax=Ferrovibrio xuzhouensis TaxID=1576914 RepID=A0ABV7VCI0_9PROT
MISFIVCAFNEEGHLKPTVETIHQAIEETGLADYEIIFVDDGSSDNTASEIAELASCNKNIRIFRNPRNLGLGVSMRLGISKAEKPSFMMVPGDNDMSLSMIKMLLICRNEADIVIAVPFNKERRTLVRNVISIIYQLIYLVTFRVYAGYITGPGIWPVALARSLSLKSSRFGIMSELNVKMLCSDSSYTEIPGYVQAGTKARSTITLRNLSEVAASFIQLFLDIYVFERRRFRSRARRHQIDFIKYIK